MGAKEEKEIHLVMAVDPSSPGGLSEVPKRAFTDREEAREFLSFEPHGGRILKLLLVEGGS